MAGDYSVELQSMDDDYLLTDKTIHFTEDKSVNTPCVAHDPSLWNKHDQPHRSVQGFNEIYLSVDPVDGNPNRDLEKEIRDDLSRPDDEDVSCVFFAIQSETRGDDDLAEFARLQEKYSDYYAAPFRPQTVDAMNSSKRVVPVDEYFNTYLETAKKYVDIVQNLATEKPILGAIPMLEWGQVNKLLEEYIENEVRALCVNFNGRSPLARNQINNILPPLISRLSSQSWEQDGFLYAMNAKRGSGEVAADFLAFALGFDCIGGYHTRIKGDKEYFEKLNNNPREVFRIFKRSQLTYRSYEPSEVQIHFPDQTNINSRRAQNQAESGDFRTTEKVLNWEQKGFAANDLRSEINQGSAATYLRSTPAIDGEVRQKLRAVRSAYESDTRQGGFVDF